MIATRKESILKCSILLYELVFNVSYTEMSNTNEKLMLHDWEGAV